MKVSSNYSSPHVFRSPDGPTSKQGHSALGTQETPLKAVLDRQEAETHASKRSSGRPGHAAHRGGGGTGVAGGTAVLVMAGRE